MADLKTTAEERAGLRAISADWFADRPDAQGARLLDDLDTLLAENAKLRGEVASLALLTNPQAARDAAATARENRAARAILATREGDDLVGAATNAMAMTELYKAMWRRDQAYAGLARQAMTDGLAECERLRGALRNVRDDYDCDGVGTGGLECRHCIALAALGEP